MSTNNKLGTLYLIPCPISDMNPSLCLPSMNFEVVNNLDYFIVENVRTARRFLSAYGVTRDIKELEFVELSEHTRSAEEVEYIIHPLLEGRSAGVISEAGCPAVADPGQVAVALCHKKGIKVVPLSGPSSIIMSVMASGLSGQSFAFNGYIPVKEPERTRTLKKLESRARSEHQSQLFIEAPYRNIKTLEYIIKTLSNDVMLCVACDIMGSSQTIITQSVGKWKCSALPDINKRPAIFVISIINAAS